MKNVDELILKSLKLINYDRSKHITEQIAPPRPPMEKQKFNPFLITKDLTPKKEGLDTEEKFPYTTYKSIVTNKNIYLPLKKVFIESKPLGGDTTIFNKNSIFDRSNFGIPSFKGIDSLSGFNVKGTKPITKNTNVILKQTSYSEPFNKEIAEKYFGSQCLKLSGKHPKYDVGYYKQVDYYIDGSGNQCTPIPYKVISQQVFKKGQKSTLETDVWQLDLPKPVKLKNGNTIQKSKFKYPKGCAPIEYDFCLRFSWENLHNIGSQDQGVYEFEKRSGSMKDQKVSFQTYVGCITDEWYPWLNSYVGYINKTKVKESTDSAGVKQTTKCVRNGYSTTGVDVIEKHISTYNLGSGINTLDVVPFNNVQQFTLSEAIKESTGDDYEIKGKLVDYTVDLKQWFVFGKDDYKTFKTDMNTNFQDYLNSADKNKDEYEDFLKDFYGKNISGVTIGVGIAGLEDMINNDKTLNALSTKYEDIKNKFLDNKDFVGYLTKISDDYKTEKSKPRPNQIVTSFLENEWNTTLDVVRLFSYRVFETMSNTTTDSLEEFTILYLAKNFGIYDKKNEKVTNLITGKWDLSDYIGQGVKIAKSAGSKSVEAGKSLLKAFVPKQLKGVVGNSLDRNQENLSPVKTKNVLDPKIWSEMSKFPLLIPIDYNQGGINTKGIKPVTIEDASTRGKSDGVSNGYLYKSQTVEYSVGGKDKKIDTNQYSYKNIVSNVDDVSQKIDETNKGEMTEEEVQTQLDQFKAYEENIKNIISKTIVLIGK